MIWHGEVWPLVAACAGALCRIFLMRRVTVRHAFATALAGLSVAVFVAPWLCDRLHWTSANAVAGVSWLGGAFGSQITLTTMAWLDKNGTALLVDLINVVLKRRSDDGK